jgi:hypothetical protein
LLEHPPEDSILLADKAYDSNAIRSMVERFFGKLKNARGLATRYGKRADNFLATIELFATRIWIKSL